MHVNLGRKEMGEMERKFNFEQKHTKLEIIFHFHYALLRSIYKNTPIVENARINSYQCFETFTTVSISSTLFYFYFLFF